MSSLFDYAGGGAFREAGGDVIVTVDFIPDPSVLAHQLFMIADELEDRAAPLALSRQIAIDDIRDHFDSETDPNGEAWAEWSDTYANASEYPGKGPGEGKLNRSGALRSAATSEGAFEMTEDAVFFEGSNIPDYGWWNNFGASRSTANGSGGEDMSWWHEMAAAGKLSEGATIPTGDNELPARQWLGMSESAEAEIIMVFDQWFAGVVSIGQGAKGLVRRYSYRGAGGRFTKFPG